MTIHFKLAPANIFWRCFCLQHSPAVTLSLQIIANSLTSVSVISLGSLRWSALMPMFSAARSFMRMYTLESSRPPTCTMARRGSNPDQRERASDTCARRSSSMDLMMYKIVSVGVFEVAIFYLRLLKNNKDATTV